jgi:hypothetical protein
MGRRRFMTANPNSRPLRRVEPVTTRTSGGRWPWTIFFLVVAASAGIRLACLFNDLWLDEIWSLNLVSLIDSPLKIFTQLLHDNNHPLNSLFLYLVMPAEADWPYRLLSWATGAVSVALAGMIGRRQFQLLHPGDLSAGAAAAGVVTAAMLGGSYLFIHYSSEARGYAPAVCFSLLAVYALLRRGGRGASGWAGVYGFACVLGLLSHLAAIQVVIGGLVWSATENLGRRPGWRDGLLDLARWHLLPCAFVGLYYAGFVSRLEVGGGPDISLIGVLGEAAAFSLGLPAGLGAAVALPVMLAFVILGLWLIWRRPNRGLAGFHVTAVLVTPALLLVPGRFAYLYPRYFIVSAAGGLILAGYVLARLWCSGRGSRVACLAILAAFLTGNGFHTARLVRDGRGQYQRALRHIVERTPTAVVTVSSDHDFRNGAIVTYYAIVAGPGRLIQYCPDDKLPAEGTQWLIVHHLDGESALPQELHDARNHRFRLDGVFRYSALSGWDWYVYRNERLLPAAPAAGRQAP